MKYVQTIHSIFNIYTLWNNTNFSANVDFPLPSLQIIRRYFSELVSLSPDSSHWLPTLVSLGADGGWFGPQAAGAQQTAAGRVPDHLTAPGGRHHQKTR